MKVLIHNLALLYCFASIPINCAHQFFLPNAQHHLDKCYVNISGYGIDLEDSEKITKAGGNPTYGEVSCQAVSTLIKDLSIGEQDVFYDLGSGVGKVCVQVAFMTPAKKIVGVELSKNRHENAMKAKKAAIQEKLLKPDQKLIFLQENILETNLDDATIILICSTCFSDELMAKLTNKFSALRKGVQILSLRKLPKNNYFELLKTYQLPMSWCPNSNMYRYILKEKNSKKNGSLSIK